MPISRYFHGHGNEVMRNLAKEYGEDKGERVFYALANKLKKRKKKKKKTIKEELSDDE